MKETLDALKSKQGEKLCEYKMGLTENLEPCGFYDDDVWYRGIADLVILDAENNLAWVIDYKTGKNAKYADKGQLELMALSIFKHFPVVKTIRAGLLFVVSNELIKETYKIHNQPELWERWTRDYINMQKAYDADTWNPTGS